MIWQEHIRIIKEQVKALSKEGHVTDRACWVYANDIEQDIMGLERALKEVDSMKGETK